MSVQVVGRERSAALTLIAAAVALCLPACGASLAGSARGAGPEPGAIDRIRAEAAAHPGDPARARLLAEWELLGEGGDVERAAAAIARAEELAPADPGLSYLRGVLAEQHAQPDAALDAFLATLERASASTDPLASVFAESSVAFINDLRVDASGWTERVTPVAQRIFAAPGRLGLPLRRQLGFFLRERALERGDVAEVTRLESALGCPGPARSIGPFDRGYISHFDHALPAEGAGALAERYDLGPGRGMSETRTVEPHGCGLTIGAARDSGAGTRVVESTLQIEHAGRYVLALFAPASVQVSVDGARVARVDRRRVISGPLSYVTLELSAGAHELELKLASRESSISVGWTLDRARADYDPSVGIEMPAADSPLSLYATVDVLMIRDEAVEARERLRGHVGEGASTALLLLASSVAARDPFVTDTQAEDAERSPVRAATERDPAAYRAAARMAEFESAELEGLRALREVAARFPQIASLQLRLASVLREAGYDADADEALAAALAARPDSCAVLTQQFEMLMERSRVADAGPIADRLVACDAREGARLDMAVDAHDWDAARAEAERLTPLVTPDFARSLRLVLARASGDTEAEQTLQAAIEADAEWTPTIADLRAADARYAAGDRDGALRHVRAATERDPHAARGLRRLERALSGRDVMEPYRVDGLAVIRRFEESGRAYEGQSAVLVFDYMVTRVFEDGSAIDLVHQVYRLQTAEGVERFGELRLAGRVMTVRAVSPDGTLREPDQVATSTTMPPLHIGDYVEYEFVRDVAPRWGDAYASAGWVFQSFTSPFDHSEMVYVAPVDMELHFDARGPVPAPQVSEANGLRTYRFLMTQTQALVREPRALDEPPILPSLRAATRVSFDDIYESVLDRLLDVDQLDPAALRTLRDEVLGGAQLAPRARAQRIHRWVMEEIEEASGNSFTSAPLMVAARGGNRARVLRYLLELADIEADLVFARELSGERPHPQVPDPEVYGAMLVRARFDAGEPLYMVTAARGAAHDYLPASMAGQEAIVITSGLPTITLPASQGTQASLRVEGGIEVNVRGEARLQLSLSFVGAAGAELRDNLRQIPPAERARVIAERFAPTLVPGAIVAPESVVVAGLDDWEQDLRISFVALTASLVRASGEGMALVPLFTSGLEGNFARLPSRTTTELVGDVNVVVELQIRGPGVPHPPRAGRVTGPAGATMEVQASLGSDGIVRLSRRVRVPLAAIPVADYPAFARFCRDAGQLEAGGVLFTPR